MMRSNQVLTWCDNLIAMYCKFPFMEFSFSFFLPICICIEFGCSFFYPEETSFESRMDKFEIIYKLFDAQNTSEMISFHWCILISKQKRVVPTFLTWFVRERIFTHLQKDIDQMIICFLCHLYSLLKDRSSKNKPGKISYIDKSHVWSKEKD